LVVILGEAIGVILPHSQLFKYSRNAHRWCAVIGKPGSARPEGTPAMDLELQGIRTHL